MTDPIRRRERRAAAAFLLAGFTVLHVASWPATAQLDPRRLTNARKAQTPTSEPRPDRSEFAVSGRVLRPDGSPAVGAMVDRVGEFSTRDIYRHAMFSIESGPSWTEVSDPFRTIGHAAVDHDGRYAIADIPDRTWLIRTRPVAWAPGFALAGNTPRSDVTRWDVTLAPAVRIEGRLLKPDGVPASGVRVDLAEFHNVEEDREKDERVRMDLAIPEAHRPAYWPATRTTDADGRFDLDVAVPRGMIAWLLIHHPDYAEVEAPVATGPTAAGSKPGGGYRPWPATFTLRLEPARAIEGVVTAKDTGEPIAGVEVRIPGRTSSGQHLRAAITDDRGRYRITGRHDDSTSSLAYAFPPAGSAYRKDFAIAPRGWTEGVAVKVVNFALARGQAFRGTVLDAATRAPVVGARVAYRPVVGNPDDLAKIGWPDPAVSSDAEGRFAITGLDGEGILLVDDPGNEHIRTRIDAKGWSNESFAYPHASARVRASAGAEAAPVEMLIRKGVPLRAQAHNPLGRPLSRIYAWCPELAYRWFENRAMMQHFSDGIFVLTGAEPGRTYRVFMLDEGHEKLGAVVNIKCDPIATAPIAVTLAPTATIRGRAVGEDGKPLKAGAIALAMSLSDDGKPLGQGDLRDSTRLGFDFLHRSWSREGMTTPGVILHERLIPDVRYALTLKQRKYLFREIRAPKPGEVIDLGDVVVDDNP